MNSCQSNPYAKYECKTKTEVKDEAFANMVPFDHEAFQFIIDMYYGAFEKLVD